MLKISREDVSCDAIQQFPVAERFLKLPVERYMTEVQQRRILDGEPNRPQIALINAVNNPNYRFVVAAYSRRVGKTTIANMIAQLACLVPESHILIMSPNYSLSSISFELQRNYLRKFELEIAKDNAKERIIEISNGSTIRMGSVSQVDSCVGRSYTLLVFDEAALTDEGEEAFNIALRPTLDKENSKAIFISTPRGKQNWFARFFERGFMHDYPQWVSLHCDWRENPRASEDDIAEARKSMSRAHFEQEYEASFNSFEGQIFNFNAEESSEDLSMREWQGMEGVIGLDVGFRDATAAVVILTDGENYYIVDEYYESERTTEQHAAAIKELEEKWDVTFIFVDSAAQQTRYDWAVNYDLSTMNAKKSLLDGIGYVQSVIENKRLTVHTGCTEVLGMLDQYRWDPNPSLMKEKPKHDRWSHMADALRYALYSFEVGQGTV